MAWRFYSSTGDGDGVWAGLDPTHWTHRVNGTGNAYWRVVGTVEEMWDKAKSLKQRWVHGIRYARAEAGLS